jgi:hypothetical protein
MSPKPRRRSFLDDLAISLWVVAIVLPLSILCWQYLQWERVGDWPELSTESVWIYLGLRTPQFSLDSFQQVSVWFFALPAALTIFVVGAAISAIVSSMAASRPHRPIDHDY